MSGNGLSPHFIWQLGNKGYEVPKPWDEKMGYPISRQAHVLPTKTEMLFIFYAGNVARKESQRSLNVNSGPWNPQHREDTEESATMVLISSSETNSL